jgi:hypothetical protein
VPCFEYIPLMSGHPRCLLCIRLCSYEALLAVLGSSSGPGSGERSAPSLDSTCPAPTPRELAECWNNGGVALLMAGDPQGGVDLLRDALLADPSHVVARKVCWCALCVEGVGEWDSPSHSHTLSWTLATSSCC